MFVNIIIPTYNNSLFLKNAISTCLTQTYRDFDITIIDDNSDEDIMEIINCFKTPRYIRYIRNETNLGPAASRNIGINSSQGDIVSFLDSDDLWRPKKLQLSVDEFRKDKEVGLTCGNYKILVNRVRILNNFYKRKIHIDYNALMKQNYIASGSVSVRRSVLDDVGLFDEKYWIAEDYDLWIRISEKYKIKYIDEVLYYYSIIPRGKSLTNRDDIQKNHVENINKIKKESRERMNVGNTK